MKSRAKKILQAYDHQKWLTPKNPAYRKAIETFLHAALELDLGKGDLTTHLVFPEYKKSHAAIVAEDFGIMAGRKELEYFFKTNPLARSIRVKFFIKDGKPIRAGSKILSLKGDLRAIAALERTVLNFLARMCGVATHARKLVSLARRANQNIFLAATRKTLYGLLDKRAASLGGALTHRLALDHAILIKDTHLENMKPKNLKKIFQQKFSGAFFGIEIEHLADIFPIAEVMKKYVRDFPRVILFDNIKPSTLKLAMDIIKHENLSDDFLFEASGGISEKNLKFYAKTGVDVLSLSSLTMNAPAFSVRLDVNAHEKQSARRSSRH